MEHPKDTIILTAVDSPNGIRAVDTLAKSLKTFGGAFGPAPIYIYSTLPGVDGNAIPCFLPEPFRNYPFALKVYAASHIEEYLGHKPDRIVWFDPSAIVLKPPDLLNFPNDCGIALRPVHIRNVGNPFGGALDGYWKYIYAKLGIDPDSLAPVRTLVDRQAVYPYFNCGLYAADPKSLPLKLWWELFKDSIEDRDFQNSACAGFDKKLFLHQAIFSALVSKYIPMERLYALPREYGYPLHFHKRLSSLRDESRMDDVAVLLGYDEDISREEKLEIFDSCPPGMRNWLLENGDMS